MLHVLLVHVDVVDHFFLGEVGELGTVCRPYGIDGTHICFAVKELTGR